ncbi:hypothetical protein L202_02896 [Cryptococcus amylolentus CBS 6039]|uniref:Uncharacterized protein n=1 Tax=Cryptococcus amylolentus CBS 6039 TaxID=1295533 RepID=A0A1E3HWR6_9TREE|nr:hypothetical protein L202_02896 [Cryptococcus amylolentus CBS 6039]ODN80737.1 hypothetical protein L202_02896 [Cryptococcus amylolentus CBS 6039]
MSVTSETLVIDRPGQSLGFDSPTCLPGFRESRCYQPCGDFSVSPTLSAAPPFSLVIYLLVDMFSNGHNTCGIAVRSLSGALPEILHVESVKRQSASGYLKWCYVYDSHSCCPSQSSISSGRCF